MIPLEYTCIVLLLAWLQNSSLELMKELTHHSWVKIPRHLLRCSACGGPTIKTLMLRLLVLLWLLLLVTPVLVCLLLLRLLLLTPVLVCGSVASGI